MGVRIPPPLPILQRSEVTDFIGRVRDFFREVLLEFKRVTWPSQTELINSTAVVIVVTVVLAFFLGVVDIGLTKLVERILR
jgi:preprotein translocase subunit SecE